MTRKNINDLLPDTEYAIRIRATGPDGNSEWSRLLTFVTAADTVNPSIPTNVTWVSSGDSFHGEWDAVTTNTDGETIPVTRYEIELTANAVVKIDSVVPSTGASKVTYDLSFEANRALFETPKPTISFRVRAVDNKDLKSDWTDPISASNPPPSPPTSLVITPGQDLLDISWAAPTGATDNDITGYNVYVGTTAGFTPTSANRIFSGDALRFVYTTTTYSLQYIKVKTVDKFSQESTAVTGSGTPNSPFTVDSSAPATPVFTVASSSVSNNPNGIGAVGNLAWTQTIPNPDDLAGFEIRYRKVGDTNYSSGGTFDKDTRAATISLPTAFTNYEFQIRSFDWSSNNSAWTSTLTLNAPANAQPQNITGLTGTAGRDSIVYSWTPVSDTDIKNYEVTFSTSSTFASGNITYLTGNSTTLTVSGLNPSTTYYARVRAVDNGGLTSAAWSTTLSKTTGAFPSSDPSDGVAPSVPAAATLTSGLGYVYAIWTPVATNASGGVQKDTVTYEVHLGTVSTFTPSAATKVTETAGTFALIDVLPGTSTSLTYGTTYYVKLIAKDIDGSSASSTASNGAAPAKAGSGDITGLTVTDISGAASTGYVDTAKSSAISTAAADATTKADNAQTAAISNIKTLWGSPSNTTLIDGGKIYTNSIRAQSLILSDINNYLSDPLFTDAGSWLLQAAGSIVPSTGTDPGYVVMNASSTTSNSHTGDASFWATTPGESYYVTCEIYGEDTNTGTTIFNGVFQTTDASGGSATFPKWYPTAITVTNGVWTTVAGVVTMGANAYRFRLLPYLTTTVVNNKVRMRNIRISRRSGGELIVDGTVSATVLKAGTTITSNLGVTGVLTISSTGSLQSTNYNTTAKTGYKLSATGFDIQSGSVRASALIGDTLGSSTGTIQIGAGANIVLNGGYLKSNTYTGTAYNAAATAGFYLGNDGLVIAQGAIKANTLISDTLTSTVITLGTGGQIVGGGWTLSSTGLDIPNGGITATKLLLQQGQNILSPIYSDFGGASGIYSTGSSTFAFAVAQGTMVVSQGNTGRFNNNSLATVWSTNTVNPILYFGTSVTDYNIPVTGGISYVFSAYAWAAGAVATNIQMKVKWSNGTITTLSTSTGSIVNTTLTAGGTPTTAVRLNGYATAPAGVTGAVLLFESSTLTANAGYNLDGVQVEQKTSFDWMPSPWSPGTSTTINGGQIRTGEIRSTNTNVINGVTEPVWSIPLNGAATFSAMRVLGNTVLGNGNSDTTSRISSYNYVQGSTGWMIRADGTAEFAAASIRGVISASSLGIQQGFNLLPAKVADFEATPSSYVVDVDYKTMGSSTGAISVIPFASAKYNKQVLRVEKVTGGAGTYADFYLSGGPTQYNVEVEPNETYIVSAYFYNPTTELAGKETRFVINRNDGTEALVGIQFVVPNDGAWHRFSMTTTIPSGCTWASFRVRLERIGFMYVDGVQVEKKTGASDNPSAWKAPGLTTIDGGLIQADTIKAESLSADAIDGMTITGVTVIGSTIETAATGERAELITWTDPEIIDPLHGLRMWTGVSNEVPGFIAPWGEEGLPPGILFRSPSLTTQNNVAEISMGTSGSSSGNVAINLNADDTYFEGPYPNYGSTYVHFEKANLVMPTGKTTILAFNMGSINGRTTGSASGIVIDHNLGVIPTEILWQDGAGNNPYIGRVQQSSTTSTQFTVIFRRTDTNALSGGGVTGISGNWIAIRSDPAGPAPPGSG